MTDKVASQDAVWALMELADECWHKMGTLWDTEDFKQSRGQLESAIRAALQASRSIALEEAIHEAREARESAFPVDPVAAIRALAAKDGQ